MNAFGYRFRMTHAAPRSAPARLLLGLAVALLATTSLPGCVARNVRHSIVERSTIEVDLVRSVRGFSVEERGFEHPTIISAPRLVNILSALEVEVAADKGGMIRQPAFHPAIVQETAEQLSEALKQASPDEEVGVKVIRKERRLGLFHQKYLTSFLAWVDGGQLYLALRHVDWLVPQADENRPLPEPRHDRKPMDFRVVTSDPIYFAGTQDLEIDWQSDVFRQAFRLPGSTKGRKVRREVLDSSPVPKAELEAAAPPGVSLDQLTPEQLRALADLEEERRAGRITETAYQRARRQLLRER